MEAGQVTYMNVKFYPSSNRFELLFTLACHGIVPLSYQINAPVQARTTPLASRLSSHEHINSSLLHSARLQHSYQFN
jgi:hypothetical protein